MCVRCHFQAVVAVEVSQTRLPHLRASSIVSYNLTAHVTSSKLVHDTTLPSVSGGVPVAAAPPASQP